MEEETSVECVISSENEKDCKEIEVVKHDLIEDEIIEPEVGLVFNSKEDAYDYYNTYAKNKGFGIIKRTSTCGDDGELKYFSIECSRAGKSRCKSKFPLKSNLKTKTNCKAGVRATLRVDGKYMLSTVRIEHNHSLGLAKGRILKRNKRLDDHAKRKVELNDQDGVSVSKNNNSSVVEADVHENLPFGEKDWQNHNDKARRLRLGMGDAEAKRYDRMMGEFYKVATLAADSDDKCNIVLAGIQDLILKIVDKIVDDRSMCGSNQLMLASSTKCVDDSTKMSKESSLARSPLTVQQKGCLTTNNSQSNVRKLKSSKKRNKGSSPDQEEAMPSSHIPHIVDGSGTQERSTLMGQPPSYLMVGTSMVSPHVLFQSQPTNDVVQQIWMAGSGGLNLAQKYSQGVDGGYHSSMHEQPKDQ